MGQFIQIFLAVVLTAKTMAQYKVLDPQVALYQFGDEKNAIRMINSFVKKNFGVMVRDFHREVMRMDFNELKKNGDLIRGTFCHVTSFQMRKLVCNDMNEAIEEKNERKFVEFHAKFLRKCSILCRELEDYLKSPIPYLDLRECIKEFLEKYFKPEELKMEKMEVQVQDGSCAVCNIF